MCLLDTIIQMIQRIYDVSDSIIRDLIVRCFNDDFICFMRVDICTTVSENKMLKVSIFQKGNNLYVVK